MEGNAPFTHVRAQARATSAQDVARVVEAAESQLHAGLEAMYSDMANSTAKALRRVMPITTMKMKWSVNDLALKGGLTKAARA